MKTLLNLPQGLLSVEVFHNVSLWTSPYDNSADTAQQPRWHNVKMQDCHAQISKKNITLASCLVSYRDITKLVVIVLCLRVLITLRLKCAACDWECAKRRVELSGKDEGCIGIGHENSWKLRNSGARLSCSLLSDFQEYKCSWLSCN